MLFRILVYNSSAGSRPPRPRKADFGWLLVLSNLVGSVQREREQIPMDLRKTTVPNDFTLGFALAAGELTVLRGIQSDDPKGRVRFTCARGGRASMPRSRLYCIALDRIVLYCCQSCLLVLYCMYVVRMHTDVCTTACLFSTRKKNLEESLPLVFVVATVDINWCMLHDAKTRPRAACQAIEHLFRLALCRRLLCR